MEQSLKLLRFPLAALAVVVMSACGKAPVAAGGAMPAAKVSVAKVLEQPVNEWDEFTGRLEAPETVEIRPRVSGQIDQVTFTEGALVKKGDLLFQIDPRPYQAEVHRLEAQLQQARATANRTANEAERGKRLLASNAISTELADTRTSTAQEAKAAVDATQAQLDLARLNLSFTRVTAPISGRVSRAEITAGNIVSAGLPQVHPTGSPGQTWPDHSGVPGPVQRDRQSAPGPDELRRQPGQPTHRHHSWPCGVR